MAAIGQGLRHGESDMVKTFVNSMALKRADLDGAIILAFPNVAKPVMELVFKIFQSGKRSLLGPRPANLPRGGQNEQYGNTCNSYEKTKQ